MFKFAFTVVFFIVISAIAEEEEAWTGKYFPGPNDPLVNLYDKKHGIKMGIPNSACDDGESRLDVDYDGSPMNFTCFDNRALYAPNYNVHPILEHEAIPKGYNAHHLCMDNVIRYKHKIPTFGSHRPLWAKFGEYTFLPKQRWLHNLEHGAVTMLYHPCADKNEVRAMKRVVKSCLYKHVISSNSDLTPDRPLGLVAWGHRLTMSVFDLTLTVKFIRDYALNGPESTSKNGKYSLNLVEHAQLVSDKHDSVLCPYN
ncbi:PREDICTED: uncharacterized protein LOC108558066 [Nicrophorus vespilloides]|uniref:Uncharacterized protein LOC108558066 n=1 Tax=Nicrophorus vespilloides TaxID=110193 RepID=A0ABM1M710_NICVS|nr:PREDICTED: uncharacterized protein LOC108558066 [Nicrophorus vespilloides]